MTAADNDDVSKAFIGSSKGNHRKLFIKTKKNDDSKNSN